MDYYLIAGEASGDLHGSNLIKELKNLDPAARFRAWGGDKMEQAGAELVKHYRDLAFMGFWEVFMNISTILKNIKFCKADLLKFAPDVLILIDYPGFNLRMAKFAKQAGLKVIYYISPQVWAWNSGRVDIMKRFVDKMYVILPFEQEWFLKHNYEVEFVGHPLLDAIRQRETNDNFRAENELGEKPIVAILPGSRKQEINKMLPEMLKIQSKFRDHQFVVGVAENIERNYMKRYQRDDVHFVYGQTYDLLENASAALVTSGTATLETGLFGVPQVVCYKGNPISFMIGRWLVDVEYIAMVNLILDRELVRELIQGDLNAQNLEAALGQLLLDPAARQRQIEGYIKLRERLGGPGASHKTAKLIWENLSKAS